MVVETDKMFYLRSMRDYYRQLPRSPILVYHDQAAPGGHAGRAVANDQAAPSPGLGFGV